MNNEVYTYSKSILDSEISEINKPELIGKTNKQKGRGKKGGRKPPKPQLVKRQTFCVCILKTDEPIFDSF